MIFKFNTNNEYWHDLTMIDEYRADLRCHWICLHAWNRCIVDIKDGQIEWKNTSDFYLTSEAMNYFDRCIKLLAFA
jgi:hypothetical protein